MFLMKIEHTVQKEIWNSLANNFVTFANNFGKSEN